MTILFTILILISGLVFGLTTMMLSSKWWLGVIGGGISWGSNEYGSKKSLETTLKAVAVWSGVIFVFFCILYPFVK